MPMMKLKFIDPGLDLTIKKSYNKDFGCGKYI